MKNFFMTQQQKKKKYIEKKNSERIAGSNRQSWGGYMVCVRMKENRKDARGIGNLRNQNLGFLVLKVLVRVGGQCCIQVYHLFLW